MRNQKPLCALALAFLACVAVFMVVEDTVVAESLKVEDSPNNASVIDAIVDLKAYCLAARAKLQDSDLLKHANGVIDLVNAFGQDTGKDVITEFARTIGHLKGAHTVTPGLAGYLIDGINESVLEGRHTTVLKKLGGYAPGVYVVLNHAAFGLAVKPGYFDKLGVLQVDFLKFKSGLHHGKGGKAIEAWKKSGGADVLEGFVSKITAKYMAMAQAQEMLQMKGAGFAIAESVKKSFAGVGSEEEKSVDAVAPLPIAGQRGALKIRKMHNFAMPSHEEIKKEAMKEAKAYLDELAKKEEDSPAAVITSIEKQLEGTSIRVTTGAHLFSDSNQSPKIKIVGTKGTVEGRIDYLPLLGKMVTQTFSADTGSMGQIKRILIEHDDKVANPWLCTKFEVRVGHLNSWVEFAPHGKKSFVDGWWLDGSHGKLKPFYRLARDEKWLLLPIHQELSYTKLLAEDVPSTCSNLPASEMVDKGSFEENTACFSGDKSEFETKCAKYPKCQGFTYTTGETNYGKGCLKYRCQSYDVDTDADAGPVKKGFDYYTRQAFKYKAQEPTEECTSECGFEGATYEGKVSCVSIKDGSVVDEENCSEWKPTIMRPEKPSKKCDSTPECVKWQVSPITKRCPTSCGSARKTLYGASKCVKAANHGCKGKVTVYQHDGFTGWSASFKKGGYNMKKFLAAGAKNDDMSSLKVPAGCKAVVYQHADKSGWAATFEPGDYRMHAFLAAGGRNDDASSIDVLDGDGETVDDDKCNYWKELGAKPEVPWTICSAINC